MGADVEVEADAGAEAEAEAEEEDSRRFKRGDFGDFGITTFLGVRTS